MCTFIKCIRTSWSCALLYTVEGSSPGPREAGGDGGGAGFLGSSGAFVVDCWNTLGESSSDGASPGTTSPALVWNETSKGGVYWGNWTSNNTLKVSQYKILILYLNKIQITHFLLSLISFLHSLRFHIPPWPTIITQMWQWLDGQFTQAVWI